MSIGAPIAAVLDGIGERVSRPVNRRDSAPCRGWLSSIAIVLAVVHDWCGPGAGRFESRRHRLGGPGDCHWRPSMSFIGLGYLDVWS